MIRFVDETGSTNADLGAAIRAGDAVREGDWLVARRQTAGRGRQGRTWFDGAGNFMGSTVVVVQRGDPVPSTLSFVAAVSVFETVNAYAPRSERFALKWPNDVLLDGGKLSGILLELVGDHVVIGIGTNLVKAPELPDRATSALVDVMDPPSVERFAEDLSHQLGLQLARWRNEGAHAIMKAFLHRSIHTHGSAITVHDADGSRIAGTFVGLDQTDGALRLRLADGSERVIRAGDIT